MALVPCTECGREISTRAVACPACGCPGTAGDAAGVHRAPPAINPLRDAGLLGKVAYVLGAWAVAPHVERTIGIVAFCIVAGIGTYFLFGGVRC